MWISNEDVSQNVIDYFEDYFSTMISGTTVSGAILWQEAVTSTSGVEMMIDDILMLSTGLAFNLNLPDPVLTASGTALDIETGIPDTNTILLYNSLYQWNNNENSIYSNYLYSKMIAMLASEEPVLRLRKWFGLNEYNADVLWNMLNLYQNEQNIQNAYLEAILAKQRDTTYTREGVISNTSSQSEVTVVNEEEVE